MPETTRLIAVRDVVAGTVTTFHPKRVVSFPVTSPTLRTPEGIPVHVRDDEGIIDVALIEYDGVIGIEVRGRFAVTVDPIGANSVVIRLRDAKAEEG